MARITVTKGGLETLVKHLDNITSNKHDFSLCWAYGGVRLVRKDGSVDVLPRTSKAEQVRLIQAFIDGFLLGNVWQGKTKEGK